MGIFSRKKEVVQEMVPQLTDEERRSNDFACCYGGEFRLTKTPGKRGALSISTVFACVELISNSIAMMDINVKSKETKTRLTQIALQKIFQNNKLTKFNLIKNMVSDMLLYGNGYAKIERATDGMVVGLTYLPASEVSAFFNDNVADTYFMFRGERLLPAELIHIFKNTYNGYIGVGILEYARRSCQLANAAEDSAVDYYSSGLNINAILHATQPMTQHQADQAVRSMQGTLNPTSGSGKMKFLPFDLKLEPISQTANDAALIDTRSFNVEDIARFFNIPVSLLTDNNQNAEAIMLQFLTQTLSPYIVLFEDELNRKLIQDDDLYFDFDERAVIRVDMKSTAEYLKTLVDSAIISVNEARELLGLPLRKNGDALSRPYTDTQQNLVADEL